MVRRIILKERLDSVAADPLRAQLAEAEGHAIAPDASGVEFLGGLCLELMLCARQVWDASGTTLSIVSPSDAFNENLARFGLTADTITAGEPA